MSSQIPSGNASHNRSDIEPREDFEESHFPDVLNTRVPEPEDNAFSTMTPAEVCSLIPKLREIVRYDNLVKFATDVIFSPVSEHCTQWSTRLLGKLSEYQHPALNATADTSSEPQLPPSGVSAFVKTWRESDLYPTARHRCEVCYRGFKTTYELGVHLTTHSEDSVVLRPDLRAHYMRRRHLCQACGNTYASEGSLGYHLGRHRAVDVDKRCDPSQRDLFQRYKNRRIPCPVCPASAPRDFPCPTDYDLHLGRHSPEEVRATNDTDVIAAYEQVVAERMACPVCSKMFPCLIQLGEHITVHEPDGLDARHRALHEEYTGRRVKCEVCEKHYHKGFYFGAHIITHSADAIDALDDSDECAMQKAIFYTYKSKDCQVCKKRCSRSDRLGYHIATHDKDDIYRLCDEGQIQMYLDVVASRVKCEACDLYWLNDPDLGQHLPYHSADVIAAKCGPHQQALYEKYAARRLACDVCPVTAPSACGLGLHLLTHSKELIDKKCGESQQQLYQEWKDKEETCLVCNKFTAKTTHDLRGHLFACHKDNDVLGEGSACTQKQKDLYADAVENAIHCKVRKCKKRFLQECRLGRHLSRDHIEDDVIATGDAHHEKLFRKHSAKVWTCSAVACAKKKPYISKSAWHEHLVKHKRADIVEAAHHSEYDEVISASVRCPKCNGRYSSTTWLKRHVKYSTCKSSVDISTL